MTWRRILLATLMLAGLSACSDDTTQTNPCLAKNGGCDVNATCRYTGSMVQCTCRDGFTGDGDKCTRTGGGATAGLGQPCDTSKACDAGLVCSGAESSGYFCRTDCTKNTSACGSRESCVAISQDFSVCLRSAASGQRCDGFTTVCENGLKCVSGVCKDASGGTGNVSRGGACRTNGDCTTGLRCVGNATSGLYCRTDCSVDSGTCAPSEFCKTVTEGGSACLPAPGVGEPCAGAAEICAQGYTCVSGICSSTVGSGSGSGSGLGSPCLTTTSCLSGLVCVGDDSWGRFCRSDCSAPGSTCPAGRSCAHTGGGAQACLPAASVGSPCNGVTITCASGVACLNGVCNDGTISGGGGSTGGGGSECGSAEVLVDQAAGDIANGATGVSWGAGCIVANGAAVWYVVTVPANSQTTVSTTGSIDLILSARAACDVDVCSAATDNAMAEESIKLTNRGADAVDYFVSVASYYVHPATSGAFTISVSTSPFVAPVAGEPCDAATLCGDGLACSGDDTYGHFCRGSCDDAGAGCGSGEVCVPAYGGGGVCVPGVASGEVCNGVTLVCNPGLTCKDGFCAASGGATVIVPPLDVSCRTAVDCGPGAVCTGSDADGWVCRKSCTASGCASGEACVPRPDGSSVCLPSSEGGKGCSETTRSCADGFACVGGTCVTSPATTTGATCAEAIPASGVVYGDLSQGTKISWASGCLPANGPAVWYSVEVPASSRVYVSTRDSYDLVLNAMVDCSSSYCETSSDQGYDQETVVLENPSSSPMVRYVAVASYSTFMTSGSFTLEVQTVGITPVGEGGLCRSTPFCEAGLVCVGSDTTGFYCRRDCGAAPNACTSYQRCLPISGSSACIPMAAAGGACDGLTSTCQYTLGCVGGKCLSSCEASAEPYPISLSGVYVLTNDLSWGSAPPVGAGCLPAFGKTLWYTVEVPARSRTVVTTSGSINLVINVQPDCAGDAACSQTSDSGYAAEKVTLENGDDAARIYRVAVSAFIVGVISGPVDVKFETTEIVPAGKGEQCTYNADCADGLLCIGDPLSGAFVGYCRTDCSLSDAACAADEECFLMVDGSVCLPVAQGGELCDPYTKPCVVGYDCVLGSCEPCTPDDTCE